MNPIRKLALGAVGGALALTLAVGGVTAFAQDSENETLVPSAQGQANATGIFAPTGHFGGLSGRGEARNEYLAEALGITVDELEAAQREARAAMIADAVADGEITQEQADLLLARDAVAAHIDKEALAAETEGLSRAGAATVYQEAYDSAVAEALASGEITQDQADALLEEPFGRGLGGGRRGGFGL